MNTTEIEHGFYRSYTNIAPGNGRIVLIRDFALTEGTRVHVVGNEKEIAENNLNMLGPWMQVNTLKPIVFSNQNANVHEALMALEHGYCVRRVIPNTYPFVFVSPDRKWIDRNNIRHMYKMDTTGLGVTWEPHGIILNLDDVFNIEEI